jgi:hypothetical protein
MGAVGGCPGHGGMSTCPGTAVSSAFPSFLLMLHMHTVCAGSSMKVHGVPVHSSRRLEGLRWVYTRTISVQCAGCAAAQPLCLGPTRPGFRETPEPLGCERQSCTRDT